MAHLYENILATIGRTPIVRIGRLAPEGVTIYAKLEAFNPLGSVKDRMALGIIEAAERSGALRPGMTVVEATSGNTGIGLAMVCAVKGYRLVLIMGENMSIERRKILRFLGAKVVLTPADQKGTGMLAKAIELAQTHGWFLARQFENPANPEIHRRTTAVEILEAFRDRPLDAFVTGFGTGGTLAGVSEVLKRERPEVKIVVCEPDNSPMLGSGIAQEWIEDGLPRASHPMFRPHLVQGWAPDFIPKLTEEALRSGWVDEIVAVGGDDVLEMARQLAQKEGIFTGLSGGATFAGACAYAKLLPRGSTVLCMLPDTGERYLSTPLFEDIAVEMTAEETEISRSTPSCQFGAAPAAAAAVALPTATPEAVAFIDEVTRSREYPVVLFALEWCEFCWSVRKLFKKLDIPYRSVDLDSVEYQADNWGGAVRNALHVRVGSNTIPRVFVGGKHIGGCTDLFAAYRDGTLHGLLREHGITPASVPDLVPESLLPGWLHKRG